MTINELTATQKPFSSVASTFNASQEDSYYRQSAGLNIAPVIFWIISTTKSALKFARQIVALGKQVASA